MNQINSFEKVGRDAHIEVVGKAGYVITRNLYHPLYVMTYLHELSASSSYQIDGIFPVTLSMSGKTWQDLVEIEVNQTKIIE